jgi:4-diphosphocytidyl-2-C-methyl-D-erythritol kinase
VTAVARGAERAVMVRAPAKVNLVLIVGRPRDDGYHPLNTVYQAISLYDDVRVTEAEEWSVEVTALGPVDCSVVPLDESNIVIRAGRLLTAHHHVDTAARIEIGKGIPVAGGLAGGSADGAAALVALDRLWDLQTSDEDLLRLAGELGSDVPFALLGGTAHGTGHGEIVEPVRDRGTYWWVVVPSDEGLSTPEVYREYDRLRPDLPRGWHVTDPTDVLEAARSGNANRLAAGMRNDLEEAALSLRPELRERLDLVHEHRHNTVMLSGSGPTIVGIAKTQAAAQETRAALLEAGLPVVHVATGPVAGAHVVRMGELR